MPYVLVTPPSAEPISLSDARAHMRVTDSDTTQDALISASIVAARQYAETVTQRQLVTATWKLVLDAFPGPTLIGVPAGVPYSLPAHAILLNKSPVQSVTSVEYLDMAGNWQTMPSTDYTVETSSEPARITPVFGKIWPVTLPQIGAVRVTFVAGYGNAAAVPESFKAWIKIRVGSLYENREEVALLNRGQIKELPFVDGLLDPFRVVTY